MKIFRYLLLSASGLQFCSDLIPLPLSLIVSKCLADCVEVFGSTWYVVGLQPVTQFLESGVEVNVLNMTYKQFLIVF